MATIGVCCCWGSGLGRSQSDAARGRPGRGPSRLPGCRRSYLHAGRKSDVERINQVLVVPAAAREKTNTRTGSRVRRHPLTTCSNLDLPRKRRAQQ
jgi:hypothetical protein